jgi:hypothetical protein
MPVDDQVGSTITYEFEVGVRGDQLYLMSTVAGTRQTAVVEIFPRYLDFSVSHCGVLLGQDWDARDMLTRTIISFVPLVPDSPGIVAGEQWQTLAEFWDDGFKKGHLMFPGAA